MESMTTTCRAHPMRDCFLEVHGEPCTCPGAKSGTPEGWRGVPREELTACSWLPGDATPDPCSSDAEHRARWLAETERENSRRRAQEEEWSAKAQDERFEEETQRILDDECRRALRKLATSTAEAFLVARPDAPDGGRGWHMYLDELQRAIGEEAERLAPEAARVSAEAAAERAERVAQICRAAEEMVAL